MIAKVFEAICACALTMIACVSATVIVIILCKAIKWLVKYICFQLQIYKKDERRNNKRNK